MIREVGTPNEITVKIVIKGNILLHNITESQNSLSQDVVYDKSMNGSESDYKN